MRILRMERVLVSILTSRVVLGIRSSANNTHPGARVHQDSLPRPGHIEFAKPLN
jgi:hypothetical protein